VAQPPAAKNPGDWANQYQVRVTPKGQDTANVNRFLLEVLLPPPFTGADEIIVESFQNLSMDPADAHYVVNVLKAESAIVNASRVKDSTGAYVTGTFTKKFGPYFLNGTAPPLPKPPTTPSGGAATGATGATGGGTNGGAATPPATPDGVTNPQQGANGKLLDPTATGDGLKPFLDALNAAPSASEPRAGLSALGHVDLFNILCVPGLNCLRSFPVYGNLVWGARTLAGADEQASEWKYVPVRRLTLLIEESLYRGTKWVVFEPNDEPLWAQIRLNVGAFMGTLFRQRAFQGASPRDAYLVKCDSSTTTQNDINRGVVNIVVGFAPLKPAEFVVITIQQLAGQAGA
jgi:hypothetical protein